MFELPEVVVLSQQMRTSLRGKVITHGSLGNSPHKFVWYNRSPDEFSQLVAGKTLDAAYSKGRWLFLPLQPGYILVFGECGGKMLFHPSGAAIPPKYHLFLGFDDGSFFTVMTQMWGAMELYARGEECNRMYVHNMRPCPNEPEFTLAYFEALTHELSGQEKRSAKALLTQDQIIPGLGNAIAQDILFHARLHPRHLIQTLDADHVGALYTAITTTVQEVVEKGGRYDECNLYGRPGGYTRLMDKKTAGQPCPVCSMPIESIQYLGGSCYFCPVCQS